MSARERLQAHRSLLFAFQSRGFDGFVDLVVAAAVSTRQDLRPAAVSKVIKQLDSFRSFLPDYRREALVGFCYLSTGDYQDAIRQFEDALSLHPSKSEDSDFPGHVDGYLASLNTIKHLDEPQKGDEYRTSITQLNELLKVVPSMEHRIRGFLGASHQGLGQMGEAMKNFEQAVVLHPNSGTDENDFDAYLQNYLNSVKFISQDAIGSLKGRGKQRSVMALVGVVNSTGRVGQKYNIPELHHEHRAAFEWLTQTGEVRAISSVRVHLN